MGIEQTPRKNMSRSFVHSAASPTTFVTHLIPLLNDLIFQKGIRFLDMKKPGFIAV